MRRRIGKRRRLLKRVRMERVRPMLRDEHASHLRHFKYWGVPRCMLQVISLLLSKLPPLHPGLQHVEFFSGDGEVTRAQRRAGRFAAAFDLRDSQHQLQDFISDAGFANAVCLVLALVGGGQCTAAPVCSSFVWLCRSSTMRSLSRPLGNDDCRAVAVGNEIVSKLVLLITMLLAKNVFFILEQPTDSIMQSHPRIQWLCSMGLLYRTSVRMADFGHTSVKASWLYSGHPFVGDIKLFTTHEGRWRPLESLTSVTVDDNVRMITGRPSSLKCSQAYTPEFGRAVLKVHQLHMQPLRDRYLAMALEASTANVSLTDLPDEDNDTWPDARIDDLKRWILNQY